MCVGVLNNTLINAPPSVIEHPVAMRVLVVEDHRETAELVARALSRDGHATSIAATCEEARRTLADEDFDVVVLDLGLPDGSGLDLCRALRDEGMRAPVLMLTAQGAIAQRVTGIQTEKATYKGEDASGVFAITDTWQKQRDGSWQCIASQLTKLEKK